MRTMLATMLAVSLVPVAGAIAGAQEPAPPVPAPTVPPAAPVPPPAAAPAETPPAAPASPITIELKAKQECIRPGKHGDGLADGGKITVENPEPNQLKATLIGVAAAHCFVGCHSAALYTFRLVQEFEVASSDPSLTQASVSLQSSLNGYVRSHHKGDACLRVASVSVTPAGWASSPLSTAFPPACVCGPCGQRLYQQEFTSPEGQLLPLGRYVLVAEMVLDASADGIVNGRGVADFSSDDLPDAWKQEHDPFKDQDRKDFGFSITVTADAPASKPASARKPARRSDRVARVAAVPAPAPATQP